MFAASALAANTVCRSAGGAAAPLFTQYMFDALGVGGGGSLIGGFAVLLAPIPFIFYKYGGPIRERSKFAPTPDKSKERAEAPQEQDASSGSGESSSEPTISADSNHQDEDIEKTAGLDRVATPHDSRKSDAAELHGQKLEGSKEEV